MEKPKEILRRNKVKSKNQEDKEWENNRKEQQGRMFSYLLIIYIVLKDLVIFFFCLFFKLGPNYRISPY